MIEIESINGFKITENSLEKTNLLFIDITTLLKALYLNEVFLTENETNFLATWLEPTKEGLVDKYKYFNRKSEEHNLIKKLENIKIIQSVKGLFQENVREFYILHFDISRKTYKNYKADYKKQLQSKEWKEKRKEVFKERGEVCERCGKTDNLQIHHKEYLNNRKAWEYDTFYLEVLCRSCHSEHHGYKTN